MKNKGIILKFLLIVFKVLIFILFLILFLVVFAILRFDHADYCLEDGDCGVGRVIKTPEGDIVINKETCLEHNWEWNEKRQECKVIIFLNKD